jgi:hypothetical protein
MNALASKYVTRPFATLLLSACCALAAAPALAASPAGLAAAPDAASPAGFAAPDAARDAVALDAKDAKDAPPGNWTLGERDQWRLLQKEVDQYAALVNASCKTTIAVTFDHESFRGKLMEPGKTGMAGSPFSTHMTQSLTAVREICLKNDDGKQAVKGKITKIVLQHAGPSRAHKLEKGQLTTVLDPAERPREWQTQFSEFLKRSL